MKAALLAVAMLSAVSHAADRMVFGSFEQRANAQGWAHTVGESMQRPIHVEPAKEANGVWYRVVSEPLAPQDYANLATRARQAGLGHWRWVGDESPYASAPGAPTDGAAASATALAAASGTALAATSGTALAATSGTALAAAPKAIGLASGAPAPRAVHGPSARTGGRGMASPLDDNERHLDADLGLQTRTYGNAGLAGQSRFQPSVSAHLEYFRAWDRGRQSLTVSPFLRLDAQDDERTHFDLRELYWTRVGDNWDLHVGVRQVFWGVTEFKHLVDVVNQTDLVENIDGEDKLGQPMLHLSVVRDWGILDFMLLTGFRERTFPGSDGRLRHAVPIAVDAATFESGAKERRLDGVVRWSHALGALEWGLYHFSGTSREPLLVPEIFEDGVLRLRPHYPVIDQTGLDAQLSVGDWAVKLEAISNSGYGDRYSAFNAGFERTLVGVGGSRADLGIVVEYLFDDRDDAAFDTLFEHDLALGARWSLNDAADTQALLGVIWDVQTDEYVVSLEGSRRLGNTWTVFLEGRVFAGAEKPDPNALLESLFDADNKSASLQRDDFIQLELTRYF